MTKAFHIVPMWNSKEKKMRDVIMPGIDYYRQKAQRTREYIGFAPIEFGPMIHDSLDGVEIAYPEWAQITIRRDMGGRTGEWTVREYWIENYATRKKDTRAPNSMWLKRPIAQLAKCVEAQALRRAFPEIGGQPTFEEMAGKTMDDDYIDGEVVEPTQTHETQAENKSADEALAEKLAGATPAEPSGAPGDAPVEPPIESKGEDEPPPSSGSASVVADFEAAIESAITVEEIEEIMTTLERVQGNKLDTKIARRLVQASQKQARQSRGGKPMSKKRFEIERLNCFVRNVNPRTERHGEDEVLAVDVSLRMLEGDQWDDAPKDRLSSARRTDRSWHGDRQARLRGGIRGTHGSIFRR